MQKKILISRIYENPEFDSDPRRKALENLGKFGKLSQHPMELTDEHADNVIAVLAGSPLVHESFYKAAKDLRIIARWGVGFETVNVDIATKYGVIVTVAPEHLETVAEYTIAQWFATLKRVYSINERAHRGDASLMRNYDVKGSTLGLYGLGRIGQEVAIRAKPLLGDQGRLLVYDIRSDVKELAAKLGAQSVDDPLELFQESDTISLHVSGAHPIVTYECLCAMKPHASLINPSRGNLVDDEAANQAIQEERLYYYVVDDPINGPREIHKGHPRIISTNHCAGISVESTIRLDLRTIEQTINTINGLEPTHILNPEVLDHPRVKGFLGRS